MSARIPDAGQLTVRYVGPTPIETPVVMTARLDGRERRKLFISGEATVDGVVTATCKAIYIAIDPSVFAAAANWANSTGLRMYALAPSE